MPLHFVSDAVTCQVLSEAVTGYATCRYATVTSSFIRKMSGCRELHMLLLNKKYCTPFADGNALKDTSPVISYTQKDFL